MGAILPVDLTLVNQPQVDLVNEGGGLQGMVGPLAPNLAGGNPVKFRVNERQQLIERGTVATTPGTEQSRDAAVRRHIRLQRSRKATG